jgi:hypothetical protein
MYPINIYSHPSKPGARKKPGWLTRVVTNDIPAKPDIAHPSLFQEGPGVVNSRTTPQKLPTGEKQESDKNHNKTQPLSHVRITHKPINTSYTGIVGRFRGSGLAVLSLSYLCNTDILAISAIGK